MALSSLHFISSSLFPPSPKVEARAANPGCLIFAAKRKESAGNSESNRRIWRRRKLTKKDAKLGYAMDRIPFLEEQVRKIKESGELLTMDIERLLRREDNRFDFVNEVAAEAKSYVENNRDEYGAKKAILHVLSNRVNEAGFYREEAYMDIDPFKPGPTYLKEEL